MTSVLPLSNPFFQYKSCYSPNNFPLFATAMSTPSKPVTQEGYSSADSESKKKQAATPGAKRRPSRAGTRSVTTLTAAQLERKRANDREAQRAIRQRTKDHIESLERRIAELTSNHDNQRLLEVMQRNDQLEQENALLRERLNHTLGYVSENTVAIPPTDPSLLTTPGGAASPVERIPIMSQPRPSSASTARSGPSVATPAVSQPDAWQQQAGYNAAPTSSPIATHATIGATSDTRWSPHPHAQPTPVSAPHPPVPAAPTTYHHSVEAQQMNYYVPYGQETASQPQQHIPYATPTSAPHHAPQGASLSQVHNTQTQHDYTQPRHLPVQQQGYPSYQTHPAYIATSPSQPAPGAGSLQHAGEGLQMIQRGQAPPGVQDSHLMYGMASNMNNMKVE